MSEVQIRTIIKPDTYESADIIPFSLFKTSISVFDYLILPSFFHHHPSDGMLYITLGKVNIHFFKNNQYFKNWQFWRPATALKRDSKKDTKKSCNDWQYFIQNQSFADVFQNMHFRTFADFAGKRLPSSAFFKNWQVLRPATALKRDSRTGILLWNMRNL